MSLKDKKFTDLSSGRIVTILEQNGDIVVTDTSERIKVERILDKKYYDEYIDPENFFSGKKFYDVIADKLKSIPLDQIPQEDTVDNDSAIIYVDEEDERRRLEQKIASMGYPVPDTSKQTEMLSRILGEEEPNVSIQRDPVNVNQPQINPYMKPQQEDPIYTMFRNVKRNVNFSLKLDINDKIPRLDFIEMMEDSYNTSIIEFLADEFTQKILSDPNKIRKKIINEIEMLVYPNGKPDDVEETTEKKEEPKEELINSISKEPLKPINENKRIIPEVPKEERAQLNEGVPEKKSKSKDD